MRTVDLIHRKRDGEELSAEEISFLVDGYTNGAIPDYQASAFLMAVFFSGMTDREVSSLTECMVQSGEKVDLSSVPGVKVDKHSTGGVGDKTSLIASPLAAAAGVTVPMISGRALGHTGGTLDKLESIPGFRTNLTIDEFRAQLIEHQLAFIGQTPEVAPADGRLYSLRDATATVESIPLIASSIMSKKLAVGLDALILDVKVGAGAFMKRQVDARRLAQMMVGIGRRMDKRVQALITDMNQPLGFAIGNALEVMEVSQTLQNAGPADLTRLSLELAAKDGRDIDHVTEVGEPVQPAPEIRLTGVLAAVQEPAPSAVPALSLWIDGTRWHLQVRKVEALIPAYPAEQELQKVSGLGLRVLADPKVLSVLQSPELHDRPIVLAGRLGVGAGVLRVHSARAA